MIIGDRGHKKVLLQGSMTGSRGTRQPLTSSTSICHDWLATSHLSLGSGRGMMVLLHLLGSTNVHLIAASISGGAYIYHQVHVRDPWILCQLPPCSSPSPLVLCSQRSFPYRFSRIPRKPSAFFVHPWTSRVALSRTTPIPPANSSVTTKPFPMTFSASTSLARVC